MKMFVSFHPHGTPPGARVEHTSNKHFHTRSENKEFTTYFHSLYENVQREQPPKGRPPSTFYAFLSPAWDLYQNLPSPTYVKLDYIAQLLAQTGCLGKFAFGRYRVPNLARSRIFCVFFGFSSVIPKLNVLEPRNFYQNLELVEARLFHSLEFFCDFFRLNYCQKTARILKFAYKFYWFSIKLEKYWTEAVIYDWKS